jgi:asparagine synthetase B (glutamine-hydrolysing)
MRFEESRRGFWQASRLTQEEAVNWYLEALSRLTFNAEIRQPSLEEGSACVPWISGNLDGVSHPRPDAVHRVVAETVLLCTQGHWRVYDSGGERTYQRVDLRERPPKRCVAFGFQSSSCTAKVNRLRAWNAASVARHAFSATPLAGLFSSGSDSKNLWRRRAAQSISSQTRLVG